MKSMLTAAITTVVMLGMLASNQVEAKGPCGDRVEAFVMAQHFAKQRAKSPSSVVMPYITEKPVMVQLIDQATCTWSVGSFMDAQNGYGALMRVNYFAVVRLYGPKQWELLELREAD